jgi:polyketide biosynthesis 3-hydroxy-3-methylglutaryl-CoA synthase-like enzyme PksG
MMVGIEAINFYGGSAFLNVRRLFEARNLDLRRFDNLMIHRKSVALPCEDPVSFGVNAAQPLLDRLSELGSKSHRTTGDGNGVGSRFW